MYALVCYEGRCTVGSERFDEGVEKVDRMKLSCTPVSFTLPLQNLEFGKYLDWKLYAEVGRKNWVNFVYDLNTEHHLTRCNGGGSYGS